MEDSPAEAIKNNVAGTYNVIRSADEHGVKRFVQLSTDKAVNPTNVMGASKRITELIVQDYAKRSPMKCMTVRFGNVLGSYGSVIPLFESQIRSGGPVQVTHPDITRYFMTIPEAAQLVLQAGAMGESGAIYVLDMGSPVRILDLAEKLIRYYGYTPNEDMPIEIIGLRPGEKMYEELTLDEEEQSMMETAHSRIFEPSPCRSTTTRFRSSSGRSWKRRSEATRTSSRACRSLCRTLRMSARPRSRTRRRIHVRAAGSAKRACRADRTDKFV